MTQVAAGEGVSAEAPWPGPSRDDELLRHTAAISAGNIASRVTGFGRVIAVGGALGTTYLGNTYQSANLVSNLLFELLAAGLLSAVLVPPVVAMLDSGRREDAEHVAGAVLGVCLAVLTAVTLAGLLVRPWIMRLLTIAVDDPEVRRHQVRLGSSLLLLFIPQVLLYAVGSVATALLHGARRFAAAAFAPVANNLVVIATMIVFWSLSDGTRRGGRDLDLPTAQWLLLAVGTTVGVLAMAAVPVIALRRAGLRLRPRFDLSHPEVRRLRRHGAWAAAYLALTQVLIGTTVILANRVEGGVVAYHIAFTIFLLPHAVLAHPVLTALYPGLSSSATAGRWPEFASSLSSGLRLLAFLVLPASAVLVALATPALEVIRIGALDADGARLAAGALAAYAIGLLGYGALQLLTRASYASGDTRTPTVVNVAVVVAGAVVMLAWSTTSSGNHRIIGLGLGHSIAMLLGAGALWMLVRRRVGGEGHVGPALVRMVLCAVAAGLVARLMAVVLPSAGRGQAALTVMVGGVIALATYVAAHRLLGSPELRELAAARRR